MASNTIGTNIKKFRLAKGLTQAALGAACGDRSINQMNSYERDRTRPSPAILEIISNALGVSVNELTDTIEPKPPGSDITKTTNILREALAQKLGYPVSSIRVYFEIDHNIK